MILAGVGLSVRCAEVALRLPRAPVARKLPDPLICGMTQKFALVQEVFSGYVFIN